jgi:formate dehydrogenase subunit gamma
MSTPEPWSAARAAEIVAPLTALEGATLPMLHAVQHAFGYVPDAAVPVIAGALNLSRAEVHGCLTFYPDFRRAPPGRHVVKLCRAEACQAMGAAHLHPELLQALGAGWHETSPDGRVSVEPVYCLGLCACGPAALVDDRPVARLSAAALAAALDAADQGGMP